MTILTNGDKSHFHQKGWVVAKGFFSAQKAAQLAQWTDEISALPEVPGRHMVYWETSKLDPERRLVQRIENFCPYHAGMDGVVRSGRLMAAVETLLEAPSVLYKDKINFKFPGGAGFELHQDQQAGWSTYAPLFLTALISIDRATVESGCLQVADMPRPHALLGEEWKPLRASALSGPLLTIPTEPGDVIFFDSFVAHASDLNRSDHQRRILYLTYNCLADGDHRAKYFHDKRLNFPPDVERIPGREYRFRV
ncbi:MAG: phytanoyl-CoA dioxygenase family protein [Alphaproteobacteria bacterium]|nr:phytanoyl-CoA dioxygenase family protein [Alphaproteobacteria bacterium]